MKRKSNYVQCFYCEDMLNRPQGRAAHIRKAHPGAPYQPTPEQIAKYKRQSSKPAAPPVEVSASAPASMSPRDHLVAAISELKEHLAATRQQIPLLEGQLQTLRTSQDRLQQDLTALEGALSAIDGTKQIESPVAVPPVDAVPGAASEAVPRPAVHRRSAAGAARA
jgi:hypothetical protein